MRRSSPHRPLAGTEAPVRGLFIDRWGTLIDSQDACLGQQSVPWNFVPNAVDAIFRAQQAGWLIYLIGNESGVASGEIEESFWLEQERDLLSRLSGQGVRVTRAQLGHRRQQRRTRRRRTCRNAHRWRAQRTCAG